jgi:hypothetical protein
VTLPVTEKNIALAKRFFRKKWKERAREGNRPVPRDLRGACKFAALFAKELFGGKIQGNWHHVFVVKNGKRIDLTDGAGVKKEHLAETDPIFLKDPFFKESLGYCVPRVMKWVEEFILETPAR